MDARRRALRIGWAFHRALFRLTGGRIGTIRDGDSRVGILFLTTVGHRSGQTRRTGLFYIRDGQNVVIVPSNAGSQADPAWWRNLQATPDAEIELGRGRVSVRARRATQEEAARIWPELVRRYRQWESYRRTAHRDVPVVILEPRH